MLLDLHAMYIWIAVPPVIAEAVGSIGRGPFEVRFSAAQMVLNSQPTRSFD